MHANAPNTQSFPHGFPSKHILYEASYPFYFFSHPFILSFSFFPPQLATQVYNILLRRGPAFTFTIFGGAIAFQAALDPLVSVAKCLFLSALLSPLPPPALSCSASYWKMQMTRSMRIREGIAVHQLGCADFQARLLRNNVWCPLSDGFVHDGRNAIILYMMFQDYWFYQRNKGVRYFPSCLVLSSVLLRVPSPLSPLLYGAHVSPFCTHHFILLSCFFRNCMKTYHHGMLKNKWLYWGNGVSRADCVYGWMGDFCDLANDWMTYMAGYTIHDCGCIF